MTVTPSPRALITLDEYKLMSVDPSKAPAQQSTNMDDHRQTLINWASDLIRRYVDRPLIAEDFTEYRDGSGTDTIRLYQRPVLTGAGIAFTVTEDRGQGPITLALGHGFKLRRQGAEIVRQTVQWHEDVENVVITYRSGLYADVTAVAGDVKQWCVETADWLKGLGPAAWGARATQQGIIAPDSLPKPIREGLSKLRKTAGV